MVVAVMQNTNILPTLSFLSERLKYINATVLELTAGMQGAYSSLATANSSVVRMTVVPSALLAAALQCKSTGWTCIARHLLLR